jgi:hypothetical protein
MLSVLVGVAGAFEFPKRPEAGRGAVGYEGCVLENRPPVDVVLEDREGVAAAKFDGAEAAAAEGRALEELRWAEEWLKSSPKRGWAGEFVVGAGVVVDVVAVQVDPKRGADAPNRDGGFINPLLSP